MHSKGTRRDFLRLGAIAGTGAILAACAPKVVEKVVEKEVTKVIKEVMKETVIVAGTPQVVEKEVTKVVKETVVVEKAPEGPVELQFWSYNLGLGADWPHGKWEGQETKRYMEMHPEVEISYQALGWEWRPKMSMSVSAGNPPNLVLRAGIAQIQDAILGNCALEVELPQEFIDDLEPNYYEGLHYLGKLYQIPFYAMCNGMTLNLSIAKEAKAEDLLPPEPARGPWSMEQYLELMKKCTFKRADGTNVWGWEMTTSRATPAYYWPDLLYMWNFGTDTLEYRDKKWHCKLSEPSGIAFLQWLYDLYDKHHVIPNPAGFEGGLWNQNALLSRYGASIGWARRPTTKVDPETLVVTDEELGFDFIFVQSPTRPEVPHAIARGGPMVDVNLLPYKTRDRLAIQPTVDFALWLSDKEHQKWISQFLTPVRQSALVLVKDPLLHWMAEHYFPYTRDRAEKFCGKDTETLTPLELLFQRIFLPMPIEEAVAKYCEEIDALEFPIFE